MLLKADKNKERQQASFAVRNNIRGTVERPRLNVFQDSLYIYVQIIDDKKGVVFSIKVLESLLNDAATISACAKKMTQLLLEVALAAGITEVVFESNAHFTPGGTLSSLLKYDLSAGGLKF